MWKMKTILGLFTARDVKTFDILSFYNGYRFTGEYEKELFNKQCQKQPHLLGLLGNTCNEYQVQSNNGDFLNVSPKSIDIKYE